jgi:hypothetical protein
MAGWMLPLGVLRGETPPERIAWRTALYRVGVDGGIYLGPFLSGLIGRAHLRVLPAIAAAALAIIGLTLLGRSTDEPSMMTGAQKRAKAGESRPSRGW